VSDSKRGRPPRLPGETLVGFHFLLSVSERSDLKDVANELDMTAAEVLREAVNEFVADFRERRLFADRRSQTIPVQIERRISERRHSHTIPSNSIPD
jgi:hypothetical protein